MKTRYYVNSSIFETFVVLTYRPAFALSLFICILPCTMPGSSDKIIHYFNRAVSIFNWFSSRYIRTMNFQRDVIQLQGQRRTLNFIDRESTRRFRTDSSEAAMSLVLIDPFLKGRSHRWFERAETEHRTSRSLLPLKPTQSRLRIFMKIHIFQNIIKKVEAR